MFWHPLCAASANRLPENCLCRVSIAKQINNKPGRHVGLQTPDAISNFCFAVNIYTQQGFVVRNHNVPIFFNTVPIFPGSYMGGGGRGRDVVEREVLYSAKEARRNEWWRQLSISAPALCVTDRMGTQLHLVNGVGPAEGGAGKEGGEAALIG